MSDHKQTADLDATFIMPTVAVPNPARIDPARFKDDSQEVVLATKYSAWLRLNPMVMPVGAKVSITLPDGSMMEFQG